MPAAAIPTLHPSLRRGDFSRAPFLVIWEVTRACDLACRHCRASSQSHRDPTELSTAEGKRLLDDVRAEFGPVLVILTGGDPCKRDDLEDLIAHGAGLGLRMALSPSATPLLTRDRIRAIAAAGACRMSLSLDGADAATHDAFRGVEGTFQRTMDALRWVPEAGCEVQINSTIHPGNVHQLRDLARIGTDAGITLWSVFFLVPTGRGKDVDLLTAAWHEQAWSELATWPWIPPPRSTSRPPPASRSTASCPRRRPGAASMATCARACAAPPG
jgi:MoaA/NifB/PqqE/SkfB family radical SAM enzyme